jgi:hypothetical protein
MVALAARWVSVVMAPSASMMEAESLPLVRSGGRVGDVDVQEPSYSRRDLIVSSEEWRLKSHW